MKGMRNAVNMNRTNMSESTTSSTKKPMVGLFQCGLLRGFDRGNGRQVFERGNERFLPSRSIAGLTVGMGGGLWEWTARFDRVHGWRVL
eukprot:scaffold19740_cov100-Isochrysis_galbana.AAC.3